jgi:prepilin-type N-terminal cleavage/methylation domain-containing protein
MKKGFTYIELLISIALIAFIISLIVVAFNPASYFSRSRDLKRLKDLQTLANALTIYFAYSFNPDPDGPELSKRGMNQEYPTIFISVPYDIEEVFDNCFDPFSNQYVQIYQVSKNNLQRINGTGWVPVNFTEVSAIPISELPIDPINSFSSGYFYAYAFKVKPFKFEITAALEYKRFRFGGPDDRVSTDGGNDPRRFEVGSDLNVIPPLVYPINIP